VPLAGAACSIPLNTDPQVPRHTAGMLAELILASEASVKWARKYLESGNMDDARMFMNARMRLKALGTRQELPQFEAKIMAGIHPFEAEGRKQALGLLKDE